MKALPLFLALACLTTAAQAGTDAYIQWATSKWGSTTVGNSSAKATTWGETADPDHDGLLNLLEYACDTDPTRHNPASDCYQFTVPPSGALSSRYPQLFAWLRTDDPDLRITCQTSDNLVYWYPDAPVNFDLPPPANPHVWTQETGNLLRGLRQMHYIDVQSLAVRTAAFMRLSVSRRGSTVTSPGVDPFSFTSQPGVATGSTARSSAIVLGGFAGNVTLNIPAGVTLFVNGIAKTGSTATVKAGDTLWMQATAPGIAGVPRNYTLTIGGQSATWTFTTAAIAAVPDHPGTDSGYTPVETGVSDTGAAQISIPIVVSPGTAGMQPKLSIGYSSQGGNGPLGVGFSLSGLSTISRVGRTVAQDGVKGGVNLDANDRFALDGQRLIAINGADGADGTEYRLEFDPTSRIRSYGTEGSGPQRWVVETKAGLKMEFGTTADSRVVSSPANRVGYVRNDIYTSIPGSLITDLLNSPKYPNSPDKTQFWSSMTSGATGDNYGQRLRGYLTPKTSGQYQFHINSDDYSQLRFNPAGPSEAGSTVVLNNPGTTVSPQYNLIAGVSYFIEALHKEGPGNDYLNVYWTGPSIPAWTLLAGDILSPYDPTQPYPTVGAGAWALNSVTDTTGNAIVVTYDAAAAQRGELLVSRIAYTSNIAAGLSANQEVVFEYEDRPDLRTAYSNGLESKILKRLKAVESRARNGATMQMVRRYILNYRLSSLTSSSLLTGVAEQRDGGASHETTFAWKDEALKQFKFSEHPFPAHGTVWYSQEHTYTGDFNNDGRSDLFSTGDDQKMTVMLSRSDGSFQVIRATASLGFTRGEIWLADFNGDGNADILTRANGTSNLVAYLGDGTGQFTAQLITQSYSWSVADVSVGDFDGNGRSDFILRKGTANAPWTAYVYRQSPSGFDALPLPAQTEPLNGEGWAVGDFNGDGRYDLISLTQGSNKFVILEGQSSVSFAERVVTFSLANGTLSLPQLDFGDFNGDSITDFVYPYSSSLVTVFFTGAATTRTFRTPDVPGGINWLRSSVGDYNGDGRFDFMTWQGTGLLKLISNGDGTYEILQNPASVSNWNAGNTWYGDFDGDGKTDFESAYSNFASFRSDMFGIGDFVSTVTNTHDGRTTFTHKSLAQEVGSIHTPDNIQQYPCHSFQAAIHVVSSMTSRNGIDGDGFTQPPASPLGENTVNYRYEGAWSCLDGRGFMGFKAVETTDATSGIITRTVYESSTPLLGGRTKHTEQRLSTAPVGGSALISESDTT